MNKKDLLNGEQFEFTNDSDLMTVEHTDSHGGKEHFKIWFNAKLIDMFITFPAFEKKVNKLIEKHNLKPA